MRYRCPVCMFPRLPYPPRDYHICPCCGTEFGNDDAEFSHGLLRDMWVAAGAHWFFGKPPEHWNPWLQLFEGGQLEAVPHFEVRSVSAPQERSVAGPLFFVQAPPILLRVHG